MKIVLIDTETTHVKTDEAQVLELGIALYDTNAHNSVESLVNMPKLTMLIYRENLKGAFSTLNFNKDLIDDINKEVCQATNRNDLLFYSLKNTIRVDNRYGQDNHLVICSPENVVREFWRFVDGYGFSEKTPNYKTQQINFDSWNPADGKYVFKAMNFSGKNIATFDIPVLNSDIPDWKDNVKMRHRQIDPSIAFVTANDEAMPDLKQCFSRIGAQDHIVAHRAVYDCLDVAILLHFHFRKSNVRLLSVFDKDSKKYIQAVAQDSKEYDEMLKLGHIIIDQNETVKGAILTRIASLKEDCLLSNTQYAEIFKSTPDEKPKTETETKSETSTIEENIKKAIPIINDITSNDEVSILESNNDAEDIVEIK